MEGIVLLSSIIFALITVMESGRKGWGMVEEFFFSQQFSFLTLDVGLRMIVSNVFLVTRADMFALAGGTLFFIALSLGNAIEEETARN